jgi:ATP-dependent Clp protease ATP-binding subunit ClpA
MCADVRELVMERVRKHFQPEFLNRIDEFICFEPLRCGCWYRRTPC